MVTVLELFLKEVAFFALYNIFFKVTGNIGHLRGVPKQMRMVKLLDGRDQYIQEFSNY